MGQVNSVGCRLGCLLLSDISTFRSGTCPPSQVETAAVLSSDALAPFPSSSLTRHFKCRNECQGDDTACPDPLHKCCEIGCSHLCTVVSVSYSHLDRGSNTITIQKHMFPKFFLFLNVTHFHFCPLGLEI